MIFRIKKIFPNLIEESDIIKKENLDIKEIFNQNLNFTNSYGGGNGVSGWDTSITVVGQHDCSVKNMFMENINNFYSSI